MKHDAVFNFYTQTQQMEMTVSRKTGRIDAQTVTTAAG
jgi:hypothetical protein